MRIGIFICASITGEQHLHKGQVKGLLQKKEGGDEHVFKILEAERWFLALFERVLQLKLFYLRDNNVAKAINAFTKVRTLRPVTTRALW